MTTRKSPEEIAKEIFQECNEHWGWTPESNRHKMIEIIVKGLEEAIAQERALPSREAPEAEILNDGTCQWCSSKTNQFTSECLKGCSCGEEFEAKGLHFHTGWMKENDFGMWINEQPDGGFKFSFLDFKPATHENYRKIFIIAYDPRTTERPEVKE